MTPDTPHPLPFHSDARGASSPPVSRITSVLVKPASAVCNLDCTYCFYVDRSADPYRDVPGRVMDRRTLEALLDGYLAYSFPHSTFAFQGGEPTLAGIEYFRMVVELQQRHARNGHMIANSLQTNGVLIDDAWAGFLRDHDFLVGLSIDGPEDVHDRYRVNKGRSGTWHATMKALSALQRAGVAVNVLIVVNDANVNRAAELYRFFRSLDVSHMQFIPLAEFGPDGRPLPFTVHAEAYSRFLCQLFEVWWPERRDVRVRFFDNVAEAVAGVVPGCCTLRRDCDSYAVVEYNGDVYPCDFFVSSDWKIGNVTTDSWPELARRPARGDFSRTKRTPHIACTTCEYRRICHGGCPKHRHARRGRFDDLDWFCDAYKMFYARALDRIRTDVGHRLDGVERRSNQSSG